MLRLQKQNEAHEKEKEKIRQRCQKRQKTEIDKKAAAEVERVKKIANEYARKQKVDLES